MSYLFEESIYDVNNAIFLWRVESYDGREYICLTCHSKLLKRKVPCQSVYNKLQIFELPNELAELRKLEKVIIAKRLLYEKVTIMPRGQSPKMKGTICNVPIEADDICNVLPRGIENNGIIQVSLKKRLSFKSSVYLEPVRPSVIQDVLAYLKLVNDLYSSIDINMNNITENLIDLNNFTDDNSNASDMDVSDNENIDFVCDDKTDLIQNFHYLKNSSKDKYESNNEDPDLENIANPLDEYRLGSNETAYVPNIPFEQIDDLNIAIAPGEDRAPVSIICDEHCEELAHPHLFPTGKFGYTYERDVKLSPTKYFNQRLLNYKQKFASDSDYIFFAQSVTQHLNLNSRINIAMQKIRAEGLTAGMLSENFRERVQTFVANDEAFNFMNTLKGTPAYWKRFLLEVLAMVKQLGLPTYFMTLSCADLRWNELIEIISKLRGQNLTEEEIINLNYFERTKILNSNPVLLARHFQYRVETFFKEIIVDGSLGKVKYYAIRVEFQVRGSPHIHSLLWVDGAPILTKENKSQYIEFVDSVVKCELPNREEEPDLYNLVLTYQIHSHSKSCRKYKNKECRYSFGKYFTDRTIVAEPLPDEMPVEEKTEILLTGKNILNKVKNYFTGRNFRGEKLSRFCVF